MISIIIIAIKKLSTTTPAFITCGKTQGEKVLSTSTQESEVKLKP